MFGWDVAKPVSTVKRVVLVQLLESDLVPLAAPDFRGCSARARSFAAFALLSQP